MAIKKQAVVATLKAKYTTDGQDHSGKRELSFPETVEDFAAWAKAAAAESAKHGVNFDPIQVVIRGYSLLHQAPMRQKLVDKFGKPTEGRSAPARDLSNVEAL